MAASGNVRYSQIRSGDRSGTGSKVGTVEGALTTGKQLQFNASGNIEASSSSIGGGIQGSAIVGNFTTPVNGDFAWRNQGSATITVETNGLYLDEPAAAFDPYSNYANLRIRKKSTPATPYTVKAGFMLNLGPDSGAGGGLVWTDGTKCTTWGVYPNSVAIVPTTRIGYANSNTVADNSGVEVFNKGVGVFGFGPIIWLGMADDGTNKSVLISSDGSHWRTIYSLARTTHLTPTEIGFFVQSGNQYFGSSLLLVSWEQS